MQKFSLGRVVATLGALEAIVVAGSSPDEFLQRHVSGDWGDVCEEDGQENEFALGKRLRLFSVYHLDDGVTIWVITEAGWSATTLLLPDEY